MCEKSKSNNQGLLRRCRYDRFTRTEHVKDRTYPNSTDSICRRMMASLGFALNMAASVASTGGTQYDMVRNRKERDRWMDAMDGLNTRSHSLTIV
jgi:hypothetical protein